MLDEQRASTEPSQDASAVQDDGRLTYTLTEAASRLGISRALRLRGRAARRASCVPHRPPDARPTGGAAAPARAGRPAGLAVRLTRPSGPGVASARAGHPIGGSTCPQRASFGLAAPGPAPTSTVPAPGRHRRPRGSSRRPRWDTDAGITDRDVAALRWLGQQYAARSDVLRVLLGRLSPGSPRVEGQLGETTLRDVLDRWEDRGLVARDRLLGPPVGRPHRQGAAAGRPGRARLVLRHPPTRPRPRRRRRPPRPGAKHPRRWPLAVGAGAAPRGRQEPRPRRRHPAPRRPRRRAPGRACTARTSTRCPKRVAVEVELTRKGAARLREAWTRPRHGRWTRTVYYAPPEVAGYLTGQLQRIRPRHPIQVHPLPDVPGTTYLRPGGAS